ncbi:MAG: MFS transporter [Chloroflexi bacterium AL-W]|nr:MFS transporter [Chloroflexi bacterium AL-N1]NOK70736.1 MFS transporter [Chloroflexi bacterium AL-N10]NOK78296.1 MFS transporter [Chloroflexi bacterium AL-N5]NOK85639.1 MFS transporter [Chloroflexi bacterium AL-W]NOK92553.1 MFS transporter [Chloroflexi bacterium AL-N15]
MRLKYPRLLLLSLAFLGIQVLFAIYNAYVPVFLQSGRPDFIEDSPVLGGFALGTTVTGFIMTLDNLAAIFILPYIGALSDATVSRLGKRKPYILIGAPIAALGFASIPFMLGMPLFAFMLVVIITVLAIDVIRTPVISLMPDITPSPLRSQANGIINLMGGVGAVLAFLIGGVLYRQSTISPFIFGAIMLLIGCMLVVTFLPLPPEQRHTTKATDNLWQQVRRATQSKESNILHDLQAVRRDREYSILFLLGATFCWFLAYSALTVFFTSFAIVSLGVPRGDEAQLLTFFALSIVVAAFPGGILGTRIGRKRVIWIGLSLFALALLCIGVSSNLNIIRLLLVFGGVGWAFVVVNSFPMVLDCAPAERAERLGVYTGLYYLASQSAEIIGPVLVGGFLDLTGRNYRFIFVYAFVVLLAALILMTRVQRGESPVLPLSNTQKGVET